MRDKKNIANCVANTTANAGRWPVLPTSRAQTVDFAPAPYVAYQKKMHGNGGIQRKPFDALNTLRN